MNYLEIIGTIVGIAYLWLEYKANVYLWIAGIIMPAIYIFIYYKAGLYADFGINIYYLLAAVYGWCMWTVKKNKEGKTLSISRVPMKKSLLYLVLFAVTFVIIALILIDFTDSNVPWLDSLTTALSIVGMIMLAKKYLEQWLVWIAVDAVCCGLYIYKELYFTSALYGFYTIMAIFGFFKWMQLMKQDDKN